MLDTDIPILWRSISQLIGAAGAVTLLIRPRRNVKKYEYDTDAYTDEVIEVEGDDESYEQEGVVDPSSVGSKQ
jgi:hypothetical protein